MERIDFINIKRIQWCCDEIGVNINELSKNTGISLRTLEKFFSKEEGLTYNQLKKIADFFGRGVFFFLEEGEISEEQVHSASFRTFTNQKPYLSLEMRKLIERIERKRDEYLWLLEEMEGTLPNFVFPKLSGNIETKANQLRDWLALPEKNDFDSYRSAIEKMGIFVILSQGYNGKWKVPKNSPVLGFSLWHEKMPVIFIRKENTKERQTFTLIHELAHLILHHESKIDDEGDFYVNNHNTESVANRFAGNFLVPENFLNLIDVTRIPTQFNGFNEWFRGYRNRWGVSTEVILRRLVDTHKLNIEVYRGYRSWLKQQNISQSSGRYRYRDREPLHIFGKQYVENVLNAKNFDFITLYKASKYLDDLKIKYLHQLEGYLAGNR